MAFKRELYLQEMKTLIERGLAKLKKEHPGFVAYTVSIWTDPNAAASAISFDDREHSERMVKESNAWNKKYYDKYMAEGDHEQASLFENDATRNCNPADFLFSNLSAINHQAISKNWEHKSEGDCWKELEPALKEIGAYAYEQTAVLTRDPDFELSVNGSQDWYEFTWPSND